MDNGIYVKCVVCLSFFAVYRCSFLSLLFSIEIFRSSILNSSSSLVSLRKFRCRFEICVTSMHWGSFSAGRRIIAVGQGAGGSGKLPTAKLFSSCCRCCCCCDVDLDRSRMGGQVTGNKYNASLLTGEFDGGMTIGCDEVEYDDNDGKDDDIGLVVVLSRGWTRISWSIRFSSWK